MIRIDCYVSLLKKFRETNPHAHFEIITRTYHSILSPSMSLLQHAKNTKMSFYDYTVLLFHEWGLSEEKHLSNYTTFESNFNPRLKKLFELKEISKDKELFLVCYEKDPYQCHRSLVCALLYDFSPKLILELIDANKFSFVLNPKIHQGVFEMR